MLYESRNKRQFAKEDTMSEITIKENILGGEQTCAICGGNTISDFGPDLFIEGSMQVVCHECGRDYVPQLVHLLELAAAEKRPASLV